MVSYLVGRLTDVWLRRGQAYHRRNNHSKPGRVAHISNMAQDRRHDRTSRDTRHDQARAALVVSSETSDSESDDGGKTDGFEEESHK